MFLGLEFLGAKVSKMEKNKEEKEKEKGRILLIYFDSEKG